ncbi:MAG: NYN domain-containing protein [Chloroflexota bacterium]|nr:NYN domain-containing protein [Chloroflexota bacterium]
MGYLIDGHNLIGQMKSITLSDPHDEAKLVIKLMGLCARTGKRCVVIFDGGLPGGWSKLSTRPVEVVFASLHSNADRIMQERIRLTADPGQWIVVSNDREVLATAMQYRMAVIRSADFAGQIEATANGTKASPAAVKAAAEDKGTAPNPVVTPNEVAYWLAQFGDQPVAPRKKKPKA